MRVASGLEPHHMRRYPPRRDLHGMKANMGSQNHASVWDVGYFPPCAVAATCGIGVRLRAASRVPMARPTPRVPSGPRRSGASPRKPSGKVRACPRGPRSPACRPTASASPCPNAEVPLASKSTRRRFPTVPERSRSYHAVSTPANTAATGAERHPRNVSGVAVARPAVVSYASRSAVSARQP